MDHAPPQAGIYKRWLMLNSMTKQWLDLTIRHLPEPGSPNVRARARARAKAPRAFGLGFGHPPVGLPEG